MKIAAAILAGGKASRLGGIAKGLLPAAAHAPPIIEGRKATVPDQPSVGARRNGPEGAAHKWGLSPFSRSIIGRLINELAATGIDEVIIAASDPEPYRCFDKTIVADLRPNVGPLGGIEAALHRLTGRCESVLMLPCDVPDFSAVEVLSLLRAHESAPDFVAMAESAGNAHPLCAVVPVAALDAVSAAIDAGQYSVVQLWKSLGAVPVAIAGPTSLRDINTPADLRQWGLSQFSPGENGTVPFSRSIRD